MDNLFIIIAFEKNHYLYLRFIIHRFPAIGECCLKEYIVGKATHWEPKRKFDLDGCQRIFNEDLNKDGDDKKIYL